MGAGAWNPWAALRERAHIRLRFADLGDLAGTCETWPGGAEIVLDRRLTQVERNACLAHEIVHAERGGSIDAPWMPAGWQAVVAREERAVDREVARRLIPADEFAAWVRARAELGEPVTAHDVATEWGVPGWVARAMVA